MKRSTIRDLTKNLILSFGNVLVRPQKKASLLVVIRALQRIATSPWIYLLKLRLGKDQSQLPLLGIINYHKLLPFIDFDREKILYASLPLANFTLLYISMPYCLLPVLPSYTYKCLTAYMPTCLRAYVPMCLCVYVPI